MFARHSVAAIGGRTRFLIERMDLIDSRGRLAWSDTPGLRRFCEAIGTDAGAVLAGLVARDGGAQLGATASFVDGQAVTVAQIGASVYALRAIPHAAIEHDRPNKPAAPEAFEEPRTNRSGERPG